MASDWELLETFVERRDEGAFGELVRRHVDSIYGMARRMLGGPGTEAEDVTQAVFLLLAQKAGSIRRSGALAGWLFRTTRFCCANVRKMAGRRRRHEWEAAMHEVMHEKVQTDLAGVLDEGLATLGEKEREAILVKFLGKKTAVEAGAVLGISAEAVEKRMERGIRKLRGYFGKCGFVVPAAAVAGVIVGESAKGAPVGLAGSIGAQVGGNEAAVMIAKGAAATMRWAKVKGAVMVAGMGLLLVGGGLGIFVEGQGNNGRLVMPVIAAASMTEPATIQGNVDVAELVRDVRAKEKWIERVESFHAKGTTVFTTSPQGLEQRVAELKKQFPTLTPTVEQFPDLSGREEGRAELAFDQKRSMAHDVRDGDWDDMKIWDGEKSWVHTLYFVGAQEGFSIGKTTEPFTYGIPFDLMPADEWGENFSWVHRDPKEIKAQRLRDGDFRLVGRENYEGRDCYVLRAKGANLEEWHVGVKDHLLYKMGVGQQPGDPLELQLIEEQAKKRGVVVTDDASARAWLEGLSKEERKTVSDAMEPLTIAHEKPVMEFWFLDYAEVAKGCWYPKRQGQVVYGYHILQDGTVAAEEFEHPWVQNRWDTVVTNIQVGEKLPDEMFVMQLKEGVNVWDETQEVPVSYVYRADMTAEEMAKIVQNAKLHAAADAKVKALQDGMVGQAAPAFGEGMWLNEEPLTWEGLKGKVVILEFFSEWCGPCRNEYPLAVEMDKDREKNGVVVIGIHAAGSRRTKIEKLLKEFGMNYPVYVDTPAEEHDGWGKLFVAYHVDTIPQAVLVDQEGKVAGHGSLGGMARLRQKLLEAKSGEK